MRAITIAHAGGPEVLTLNDVAQPEPGPHDILVRVHATAVNRADIMQRMGRYPAPAGWPAGIPGLEYAGVVEACSADVQRWREGDRVMGLVGGGSYAEYVATHEDEAMRVPDSLGFEQAAAIPEAFITAHDALFTRLHLKRGESLLVHAVGSGVGTAALQLAKSLDTFVLGTQRSAWKLERARELGLDAPIEADASAFADRVIDTIREFRDEDGVDAILDLVGGPYLAGNLRAIRVLGRIAVVGLVAGATHELDMRLLLNRRATITGTVLRARSREQKVDAVRAFERDVIPLIADGRVLPVIDQVMPLADAARAHTLVEGNQVFGKVVLMV